MTDEQKFLFDLKGYLLVPGVLSAAETAAIREHVYRGAWMHEFHENVRNLNYNDDNRSF